MTSLSNLFLFNQSHLWWCQISKHQSLALSHGSIWLYMHSFLALCLWYNIFCQKGSISWSIWADSGCWEKKNVVMLLVQPKINKEECFLTEWNKEQLLTAAKWHPVLDHCLCWRLIGTKLRGCEISSWHGYKWRTPKKWFNLNW